MLEELEKLIKFIQTEYIQFNKKWQNSDYYTKINLKDNLVINLSENEEILNAVFNYREFINENNIQLLMDFKQFNTNSAKINIRTKAKNSIEYKIKNYIENHENGKVPINKCLNDLFGVRIICTEKIENPKVKLVIMGSSNFRLGDYGSYPQEIKSMVDRNKGRIVFTGFINNNELYKYHQIANVGVVPSMHNDPCPLSLFELITSGLPTIATKAGGMPEIGNNDTTIFVEMDNIVDDLIKAINMLYNDEQLRISMSKAAIKRAMLFKQKRFYDDFCSIVNGFIDLNEKSDD